MLLSSMHVIPRSQHEEESLLRRKIEEESSLLRGKIEELNRNTVLLIAEAGRLIQGSKQLSDRLKSFENPARSGNPPLAFTHNQPGHFTRPMKEDVK
jgi:hypothetical protein